jgi:hypothetical protein
MAYTRNPSIHLFFEPLMYRQLNHTYKFAYFLTQRISVAKLIISSRDSAQKKQGITFSQYSASNNLKYTYFNIT